MSPRIVLARPPEGFVERVRAVTSLAVDTVAEAAHVDGLLADPGGVAAVVLGPDVGAAVKVAQRVARADRRISVVILRPPGSLDETLAAIQFAPFLGDDVSCRSDAYPDVAARATAAAAERTLRRRQHSATIEAAGVQLGRDAAPLSPAATARTLGTLLEQAPVGVITVDSAGRVVAANRHAERLFGHAAPDLANRDLTDLFPVEDQARLSVMLMPSTPLLPSPTRRFRREGSGGEQQYLDITAARFETAGSARGTILLVQEVSDAAQRERHSLAIQEEVVRTLARARAAAAEGQHELLMGLLDEALRRAQRVARELLSRSAQDRHSPLLG